MLSECTVHGMCVSSGAHCKTEMLFYVFFFFFLRVFFSCEIQRNVALKCSLISLARC